MHPQAIAATLLPGMIRLGRLSVPVFGLFAAAGIIAALTLSQRTARKAGLAPDRLWDAGMMIVTSAFVFSRILVVAENWRTFLAYPLVVLLMPSLTYAGMALTAIAALIYLRRRHIPLRPALDAWSPCAALLAAVLAFAHFIEGTEAGMPTSLALGVTTPGDHILGRVHPVELYMLAAALALTLYLLAALERPHRAGSIAARAMLLGGSAFFLLDMLAQPAETLGDSLLDPGQWIALAAIILGAAMLLYKPLPARPPLTRCDAAVILERLAAGTSLGLEHEEIEYGKFNDPLLLEIQERMPELNEGPHHGTISQEESNRILLAYAHRLRTEPAPTEDPA